jgi:FeS assembly protein SufD
MNKTNSWKKTKKEPSWITRLREKARNSIEKPLQEKEINAVTKHLISCIETETKKHGIKAEKGEIKVKEVEEKGLIIKNLGKAVKENEFLVKKFFGKSIHFTESMLDALHHALWNNGILVYVDKKKKIDDLTIEFKGKGNHSFFHSLIVLEEKAEANITEKHSSENKKKFFYMDASEILIGKNAKANITTTQNLSCNALVFSNKRALIEENGKLDLVNASFGGKTVKQKINVMLSEQNAKAKSLACFFADKTQEIDVQLNAVHLSRNTHSKTLIHSVAKDASSSTIRGLINVSNKAWNSKSEWHSNTLMLGEKTKAHSLPALEINTNDVSAEHGSSFGNLSEEEIFYLKSRGLKERKAKELIVQAHLEPIISRVASIKTQNEIRETIKRKIK